MNVVETIREKDFHLPPKAQIEVLGIVEQIEERYHMNGDKFSPTEAVASGNFSARLVWGIRRERTMRLSTLTLLVNVWIRTRTILVHAVTVILTPKPCSTLRIVSYRGFEPGARAL